MLSRRAGLSATAGLSYYVLLCLLWRLEIENCSVYYTACQWHNMPFAAFFNKIYRISRYATQLAQCSR